MLRYSIIVCTFNRCKYIYPLLESIAHNEYASDEYEIVFIDNNCTDGTQAEVERFQANHSAIPLRYFKEERQGLSHARNRGMKEANGEYFIFVDDDAILSKQYLQNLDKRLNEDPSTLVFGGKITPRYESGKEPEWMNKWAYSWVSALDMGEEKRAFKPNQYPIGANMGFHRSIPEKIGTFNTQLGRCKKNMAGGEEKDFFLRIQQEGIQIQYLPDVQVEHCIPQERTTRDYIKRFALGVGKSERIRTTSIGKASFLKRCFSEMIKWGGTLVLWCYFAIRQQYSKGNALVLFRYHVSKGLFLPS